MQRDGSSYVAAHQSQIHKEKENPPAHKSTSSFVLNRAPIEITPIKRVPLGNLPGAENTPNSVCSRVVLSGGKERDTPGGHSRASIFSGAVRIPKKEKSHATSHGPCVTPSGDAGHHAGTGTGAGSASSTISGGKKHSSAQKAKHSYMQTTEAYRYSVATPSAHRSPNVVEPTSTSGHEQSVSKPHSRNMTPTRTPTRVALHNHTPVKVKESPARNTKSPLRCMSTPPSVKRNRTHTAESTPVRNKTPVRSASHGSDKGPARTTSAITPTRSPAHVPVQKPRTPSTSGGQSDVFSRLTANLPTRHTAPVHSISSNKSKGRSSIPVSTKKSIPTQPSKKGAVTAKKASSPAPKTAAGRQTKEAKVSSKVLIKKKSKKSMLRDPPDKIDVYVQEESATMKDMDSPNHNHSKSLIRDSSASSVMSMMSALPEHDFRQTSHTGVDLMRQSQSPSPNMFQVSPATFRLFSERPSDKVNLSTEPSDLAITRHESTTPIGMSEGTDFDDNDTSDLTMTTIGSLASVMPLLVIDSCVSLPGMQENRNEAKDDAAKASTLVSEKNDVKKVDTIALIPDDADDVSAIYDDRNKSRRESIDNEVDVWSRSSSPRSLALSACWTQTTTNTFDLVRSPLPFYDPQFDDELVTASMNSKTLHDTTLAKASSPRKKVFMNANLRAELSPQPVKSFQRGSANNSVISATPSVVTQMTNDSSSLSGYNPSKGLLNEAMIRGESFSGLSVSTCPSVVSPFTHSSAFSSKSPKSMITKINTECGADNNTAITISPTSGSEKDSSHITLDSSIHTINTVASFNTAHTLNLSSGTSDTYGGGKYSSTKMHILTDTQTLNTTDDGSIITPLSTATSTVSNIKVLNRGFCSDDDPSIKISPATILEESLVQPPKAEHKAVPSEINIPLLNRNVSSITHNDTDSFLCCVIPDTNTPTSCTTFISSKSTPSQLNNGFVVQDETAESSFLRGIKSNDLDDSNFSDTLPSIDTKPELLAGGSWDEEYSTDMMIENNDDSICAAFQKEGNALPTPIISSHTRDKFTFDLAPPPPPPSDDLDNNALMVKRQSGTTSIERSYFEESSILDVSNESTFYDQSFPGPDVIVGKQDGLPPSNVRISQNDRDIEPLSKTLIGINSPLVSLMDSAATTVGSLDIPSMNLPPSIAGNDE